MASTYLSRTTSVNTSTTWTWSAWVKRSKLGTSQTFLAGGNGSSSANALQIRFSSDDTLDYRSFTASNYNGRLSGGRKYRDTSAWYHFVFVWDTTQASSGNRMKAYCNGEIITGFTDIQNPSQNSIAHTADNTMFVGTDSYAGSTYFDGSMSHIHFIDGTAYDASAFGSTDSTTGEWKINTSPSVTYGTNGFFILKDGNSVTDQSGQGNNFTVAGGTLTKTEDCPDNVFATINSLVPSDIASLSKGNTTLRQSDQASAIATLGFQGGKYYWEVKNSNQQSYTQIVGVLRQVRMEVSGNDGYNVGTNDGSWGYFMQSNQDNGKSFHNNSLGSVYQTTSVNDILQVAVDGDAGKIWWGVNGTWVNSGDPANGTNAVYTNLPTDDVLFPAFSNYTAGQFQINFGNGYFGTTAVSSAGTNASGNGIFEYDVPTGFTALSTKGLNL